jgi:hypothetical protein
MRNPSSQKGDATMTELETSRAGNGDVTGAASVLVHERTTPSRMLLFIGIATGGERFPGAIVVAKLREQRHDARIGDHPGVIPGTTGT